MNERTIEQHESYGMLAFNRVTHTDADLYGTSVEHNNTITMQVKTGYRVRNLNNYNYFGDKEIVEVEMSYSQFYDAIANMNFNDGVPVTIRRINGKRMKDPPKTDVRGVFENEFKETLKKSTEEINAAIEKVTTLLETKKNVTKADKESILQNLIMAQRGFGSTAEFIYNQFNEQMDKSVTEAKGEVEAFIDGKIRATGLETLGNTSKAYNSIELIKEECEKCETEKTD